MSKKVIYSNIDLDGSPIEKMYKQGASYETLANVLEKIARVKGVSIVEIRESSRKGFHIRIACQDRDLCLMIKMVFDDFHRLYKDFNRKYYHREVLFNDFRIYVRGKRLD